VHEVGDGGPEGALKAVRGGVGRSGRGGRAGELGRMLERSRKKNDIQKRRKLNKFQSCRNKLDSLGVARKEVYRDQETFQKKKRNVTHLPLHIG
jgi:superfamily II DNA/RNA helicase